MDIKEWLSYIIVYRAGPGVDKFSRQLPVVKHMIDSFQIANTPVSLPCGANYTQIYNTIQSALLDNCANLVNPDNTLTTKGVHVRDCIESGAVLAAAAIAAGTPPTTIVSVLPTLVQLGGCGDVADFSKLSIGQLQNLGGIFR